MHTPKTVCVRKLLYSSTYVRISSHIFVYFEIAEAAVSYFLKKLAMVDYALKEEQLLPSTHLFCIVSTV